MLKSRMPTSDICKVRGIGVAVRLKTSTSCAHFFQPLLVHDAEAVLLVDDHQSQIFELDILLQQPMGADDDIDLPLAVSLRTCAISLLVKNRLTISMRTG